jgi:metal-responsive CopG/Arc/MetJ family transcriptional regulator
MVRTQVYITEKEKRSLEILSHKTGKSQSELIRIAIDSLIEEKQKQDKTESLKAVFGMWKDNSYDFESSKKTMDR